MPRNDQIIRQWHLLREMESPSGKTLKELVNALPQDYARHERTLRRDLEALEASGVPLITEKTNGQVRWRCMDGYRNTFKAIPAGVHYRPRQHTDHAVGTARL